MKASGRTHGSQLALLTFERMSQPTSLRVTETAHWLEWQNWVDPIPQRPLERKDGRLFIPEVPGVGIEWNESAVTANRKALSLRA